MSNRGAFETKTIITELRNFSQLVISHHIVCICSFGVVVGSREHCDFGQFRFAFPGVQPHRLCRPLHPRRQRPLLHGHVHDLRRSREGLPAPQEGAADAGRMGHGRRTRKAVDVVDVVAVVDATGGVWVICRPRTKKRGGGVDGCVWVI